VFLVDANPFDPKLECFHVNDATTSIPLEQAFVEIVELVAERNFDLYEEDKAGNIRKVTSR
jgi:hypothetical protein